MMKVFFSLIGGFVVGLFVVSFLVIFGNFPSWEPNFQQMLPTIGIGIFSWVIGGIVFYLVASIERFDIVEPR